MSKLPVQHRPRSFFPELSELFEGFPSWASLRPTFGSHIIRVEDETEGRQLRASCRNPRSRSRPRTSTSRCVTAC